MSLRPLPQMFTTQEATCLPTRHRPTTFGQRLFRAKLFPWDSLCVLCAAILGTWQPYVKFLYQEDMGIKGGGRFEKKPLELIRPRKNLSAMKEGTPVLVGFIPCLGLSRIQEGLSLGSCGGYYPRYIIHLSGEEEQAGHRQSLHCPCLFCFPWENQRLLGLL